MIDIRELNEKIERQSGFITNLMAGMDQVIVGQKHLVESLLIGLLAIFMHRSNIKRLLSGTEKKATFSKFKKKK